MEDRITNLEMKFTHQEDYIQQLNKVVVDQQAKIERMEKEMQELRKIIDSGDTLATDTKPPHY